MSQASAAANGGAGKAGAVRFLLFIAGLGGLLYGIDVGIIAGALTYLEATARLAWHLSAQQISFIVAAVLLGSVFSSLFAGMLADLFGRRSIMFLSGLLFVASIPTIALASGYTPLLLGRLLQGISGGLIGVVVPLYLAECLPAKNRGQGTALFQWLLTFGLVVAALIGLYFASYVDDVTARAKDANEIVAAKDYAWRSIFWISIVPGVLFTVGSLFIAESSRWLYRRGRGEAARNALLRTRTAAEAELELREMEEMAQTASTKAAAATASDSLLSRKYMLPFFIACVILACTQATGVNSILAYIVNVLNQAGLPGSIANRGDVALKVLNFLMTIVAVVLVDRVGRKVLLMFGTAGIVVCLAGAGLLFMAAEGGRTDCVTAVKGMVKDDSLKLTVNDEFLARAGVKAESGHSMQLTLVYAYGPFTDVQTRRTDDAAQVPIEISRDAVVQEDSVIGKFFRSLHLNPFADPAAGKAAELEIRKALVGPVPGVAHGWLVAACLFGFMAFFAVGPGVCVWLALSELMPTRIRSNGMSIALLINQFVSTTIAAVFLPTVGKYGYSAMFFFWSGCTVIYFLTAAFFLPETKGKTLEEIEEHFSGHKK
jgi:MFS transporter, SP family, solute carrier family 2 (myo-inositol transporter), member 13